MPENTPSAFDKTIESEGSSSAPRSLDPVRIVNNLLIFQKSAATSAGFTQSFLKYLASQPGIVFAAYYSLDEKTKEISLLHYQSTSPEIELSSRVIPPRSNETLARVTLNAQPLVIANLEAELIDYQNGYLDQNAKSLFIYPLIKSNEVTGLLDIQSSQQNGFNRDDVFGLSTAGQLFGSILDELILTDKDMLSLSDLVNYSQVSRQIISTPQDQPLQKVLLSAFSGTDLVAFLFKTGKDDLILEDLYDAKGTGFDASLIGLKVTMGNLRAALSEREPLFFSDLSSNVEMGDLFAFFIRRECTSIALLPIFNQGTVDELLIIGSRQEKPLDDKQVLVYQKIVENYQYRLGFDFRARQSNALNRDIDFLKGASELVLTSSDRDALFHEIHNRFQSSYGSTFLLRYFEMDSTKSSLKEWHYESENPPMVIEKPISPENISILGTLNDPILLQDENNSLLAALSIDSPGHPSVLIPIAANEGGNGVVLIEETSDKSVLEEISPSCFSTLSKLVSGFLAQSNLRAALSFLDQTVSRTVNLQQTLNQISLQSSAGRSLLEVLNGIPSRLVESGVCEQSAIFTPSPDGSYEVRSSSGFGEDQKPDVLRPGEKLAGMVIETRTAEIFNGSQEPGSEKLINARNQSALAVPINFGDELFAVLQAEHSKKDQYNDYDLELMQIFAQGIGSLLANLKLVDQVRTQVDRQQRLFEVTSKLRRSLDMQSILEISASEIAKITDARKTSIQINVVQEPLPASEESDGVEE